MAITRRLLPPDQPLVLSVVDALLAEMRRTPSGVQTLAHLLVIVPTKQSGRTLRRTLAKASGGCIPPLVSTPSSLLRPPSQLPPQATTTETLALLAKALVARYQTNPDSPYAASNYYQALQLADRLLDAWRILESGALDAHHAYECLAKHRGEWDVETERWAEIVELQRLLTTILKNRSLTPSYLARQAAVTTPQLPHGIEKVILPAMVDVNPCFLLWLDRLSCSLEAWLPVPPEQADAFDAYGHPLRLLPIPHLPLEQIHLCRDPKLQAEEAFRRLADFASDGSEVTLGVLDPTLQESLAVVAQEVGIPLHNPTDHPLNSSTLGRLMALLTVQAEDPPYALTATRLRQPDIRHWLEQQGVNMTVALRLLDDLQASYLPPTAGAIYQSCQNLETFSEQSYQPLRQALDYLQELLKRPTRLERLREIFRVRTIATTPSDRQLQAAATSVMGLVQEMQSPHLAHLSPEEEEALFTKRLESVTFHQEAHNPQSLVTDGWLELLWSAAPRVVISGFNEGCIPSAVVGHPFLPDSLRAQLGLVSNQQRLYRDCAIFATILRARKEGCVQVLLEALNQGGDVLKPSRLLLQCQGETFLQRVRYLYQDPATALPQPPPNLPVAWQLNPPDEPLPKVLSVTALEAYHRCPFTFYLERILLKGSVVEDPLVELSELSFGTLMHAVLEAFARSHLKGSEDADEIDRFLQADLQERLRTQFAQPLSLALTLQAEMMSQRLSAFAVWQANQSAEGWTIEAIEHPVSGPVGPYFHLRGKIDRIDRHRDGRLRLMDYKTGEAKVDSIQLPLYLYLYQAGKNLPPTELAYLELTTVASSLTPIIVRITADVARQRAEALLEKIQKRYFWPPKNKTFPSAYASLFFNSPAETFSKAWQASHTDPSLVEEGANNA